jgi:hypothetical protein
MSTFSPDAIRRMRSMPITTNFYEHERLDLRKVGKDIYELLTSTRRDGYKQRLRKRTIKIEPEQNYAPGEVAAFLNVSYDAALRLMDKKIKGVVDLGTPTRRYKRGKKKLRVSGKNLLAFLRSKTRE